MHAPPANSAQVSRRLRATVAAAWLALVVGALCPLHAHGDLEPRIHALSQRLQREPDNAGLYLARGELHARHEDYAAAEADFSRAATLAPELPGLERARGRALLDQARAEPARLRLDRAVAHDDRDAEARVLRARAWALLGDAERAATDFDAALRLIDSPPPDLYLERAAVTRDTSTALVGLNEGIARIGPLPALHLAALRLEEARGDTPAMLARLDALMLSGGRREVWLVRRSDVLVRAGRAEEAKAALGQAAAEIRGLPTHLQTSAEMQRLAEDIKKLDAELAEGRHGSASARMDDS